MADAALATQSRAATNVSRLERSTGRGPTGGVRAVTGSAAFSNNVTTADFGSRSAIAQQAPRISAGGGLLSNSVQMVLAETRTQEAGAKFVAPSNVDRALNSYIATQAKIKDTIRQN